MSKLNAALELLNNGLPILPIRPETKRPRIKWKELQTRLPTVDEVTTWWTSHPNDEIALITGALSGYVVVDCDNEDALAEAERAGMRSAIKAKTKRGYHLYFRHPRDGVQRGPKAGVNSRGHDWPRIDGLDFRGDGSYVLVPPSTNYEWEIPWGFELETDAPVWQDWRPTYGTAGGEFSFRDLDLSDVAITHTFVSEWDRTEKFASEHFKDGKIPSGMGNGRNERVMRYASECILDGYWAAELRVRCRAFMRHFFVDALDEPEFEATVASMEQSERRNHPERFDENGEYVYHHPERPDTEKAGRERRLILMSDIDDLEAASRSAQYLIEPWLQCGSITQVHGYSGHGKSMFVQHCMAALASGKRHVGPFEVMGPARVLYLDFEMGRATIARRLAEMRQIHGDTEDRLQVWTPFIDDGMNFHKAEGVQELQAWIEHVKPDVVVIDTVRTAWPGLAENSSDEWAKINSLAVQIRNAGIAVVLVHHSNKPGEGGLGREAGSTNQLTTLETQIRVTQVYDDEDTAKNNAALFDGDYSRPVFPALTEKLPDDWRLYMCMEIRYGKVREWTDLHDRVQWFGLAECLTSDMRQIVSSRSTKQRCKDLSLDGIDEIEIANLLSRPVRVIRDWLV